MKTELTKRRELRGRSDSPVNSTSSDSPVNSTASTDPISKIEGLTTEQEKFLRFLHQNPTHELSTVDVYKSVGLSARKGNVVKNELLERKLVKIQEEKNDKGWKKLIRLNLKDNSKTGSNSSTVKPNKSNSQVTSDSELTQPNDQTNIHPHKSENKNTTSA